MTLDDALKGIEKCIYMLEFEYDGRIGNIDPCYNTKAKRVEYLLYFDGYEVEVYNMIDVANTPFIDGKTFTEAFDDIHDLDWA